MHSHANKSHIWPQPPHRFISRAIKSVPVKNFNRWQPRHDPFATIYVPKILLFLPLNRCRSFGGVHVRVSVCFPSFRPRCSYSCLFPYSCTFRIGPWSWVGEEWGFVRGLIISTEGLWEHSILHYTTLLFARTLAWYVLHRRLDPPSDMGLLLRRALGHRWGR